MKSKLTAFILLVVLLMVVAACGTDQTAGPIRPTQDSSALPTPIPPQPTMDVGQPTPTPEALPPPEGLDPASDLAGASDTAPNLVEIAAADGTSLAGTYYPAPDSQAPALLLIHMLDGDRQVWNNLARTAQEKGYAVLAIDLRGHGDSKGKSDQSAMDQDVQAALEWLGDPDGGAADRVVIIGASLGANLAMRAGADQVQVAGIGLISPLYDYQAAPIEDAMSVYGNRPLLVIAAENDRFSSGAPDSLKAQESATTIAVPGKEHGTNLLTTSPEVADAIFAWLEEIG